MKKLIIFIFLVLISISCFSLPVYRDYYTGQTYYILDNGKTIYPEDLRINQKNPFDTIKVGEEKPFDFQLNYGETYNIEAYSDSDCIEINYKNGIPYVKAIKPGNNVSIMRYAYGPLSSREAEKTITVLPPIPNKINITLKDSDTKAKVTKWITNDAIDSISIPLGEVINLKVELMPYNDYYPDVKYFSSIPDILSINKSTGEIEPLKEGKCIVSVVCGGKKQKLNVSILPYEVESVKIECKDKKIEKNQINVISWEKIKLNADILPDEAQKNTIEWSSNNEKIAQVDSDGTVTFNQSGKAQITVCVSDKSDTIDIKVTSYYMVIIPIISGIILLLGIVYLLIFLTKKIKKNKTTLKSNIYENSQDITLTNNDINNEIIKKDDNNGLFPD